ncbi:MAG: hypothetical protein HN849_34890 [Victivallales bacterium]|jgi:serine/threonine-protein phosphatase CPPED1|nr:hypothetical protein [Lentisphaerota bacterium]MBT7057749.1 hypothetical protein [Lentisphaerota bacterium]MBT7304769.1 hypothetical protein [Victivallales bacterium]
MACLLIQWRSLTNSFGTPLRRLAGLGACVAVLAGIEIHEHTGFVREDEWLPEQKGNLSIPYPSNFSFAVFGDSKRNFACLSTILRAVDRDPEIAFAIHTGDLVGNGKREEFRDFMECVAVDLHKPFFTVAGNHDVTGTGREPYNEFFGPRRYVFEVGDASFIVLDTSQESSLDEAQFQWLEQQLSRSESLSKTLVFMHRPPYDPRTNDSPALPPEKAEKLTSLFHKYQVSHVFASHLHAFFEGTWQGVPYTISGGAGARLHGTDAKVFFFHYLKVNVNDSGVHVQCIPVSISTSRRAFLETWGVIRREGIELILYGAIAYLSVQLAWSQRTAWWNSPRSVWILIANRCAGRPA